MNRVWNRDSEPAILRPVCRGNRYGEVVQQREGYGFITRDNGEEDLFVHISAVERSGLTVLSEGDRVVVDIAEGRKGPEAAKVRLV
jgi:cold shock protein